MLNGLTSVFDDGLSLGGEWFHCFATTRKKGVESRLAGLLLGAITGKTAGQGGPQLGKG